MHSRRITYQPQNPIARFFAVIAGIGLIALTLFLGVIFFAAFAALGVLAWMFFQVRRWWLTRGHDTSKTRGEDGILDVEYRVVNQEEKRPRD